MDKKLKDAYEQYHSKGFILQKATHNEKHAFRKGAYSERENEPFSPTATGYVAIIPKNIIIVDNDGYNDDNKSFEKFCDDLGYTPEPFAITPSGGEHYAFENKYPELVVGKTSDKYSALDIYAGYQSVIPIVGTTVKNKQGTLASYEWASFDEELIVNKWDDKFLELFEMRERGALKNIDDEYDDLDLAVKEQDMPIEEVEQLIDAIPENLDYDTWLEIGMAIYDRFGGSEQGYEYFKKFSEKSSEKYDENFTYSKWHEGHLIPNSITYKRLRLFVASTHLKMIITAISEMKSDADLPKIIKKVKNTANFNTVTMPDDKVRNKIATELNLKLKELKKDNPEVKVTQARSLLKELTPEKVSTIDETIDELNFSLYRLNNKYTLRIGEIVIQDIVTGMLSETLHSHGINLTKDELHELKQKTETISDYVQLSDYLIKEKSEFVLEQKSPHSPKRLVLKTNPIYDLKKFDIDEDVVDDFFNKIWNGKVYDIVKLIALTIKFKETKLNRLMVVAPSDSGKSNIFTMMQFQKIDMSRLLSAMRGDKGVGSDLINGIRKSGLLLIDEANKALRPEIKDMDKELHIDQFGSNGTQILPLYFTALTSTHSEATRNNSDEIYNRFLQVELDKSDMEYTVTTSPLFMKDSQYYTDNVEAGMMQLFKETLEDETYTKDDLRELQTKYRLPINTDLQDLMLEISLDYISELKAVAKTNGDIVVKGNGYYVKRKIDAKQYFENRLSEIEALDTAKYAEQLLNHFIANNKRTKIRVEGKRVDYYQVNMTPFTDDETEQILSEFDDLDIDEF